MPAAVSPVKSFDGQSHLDEAGLLFTSQLAETPIFQF
jgi:hypothetical protein